MYIAEGMVRTPVAKITVVQKSASSSFPEPGTEYRGSEDSKSVRGGLTFEEDDGCVDPAHGPEVDGAILPLEDLVGVVRVFDLAVIYAAPAKVLCGRNGVAVL